MQSFQISSARPSRPSAFKSLTPKLLSSHAPTYGHSTAGLKQIAAPLHRVLTQDIKPFTRPNTVTQASADAGSSAESRSALKISIYVLLWYAFNIIFNIVNKSTLNAFPCPWFIATLQLACSAIFMFALWILRIQPVPQVSMAFLTKLVPVAVFHTVGHVAACVSFGQMAVSFAHIVKSAEPVFSVALSGPLLGVQYPIYVWLSVLPIVAGCSLSAMKEVSFAWNGFNYAMLSNIGMVLRNIYSKKSLSDFKQIDGINLFALISMASFLICLPLGYFIEGHLWQNAMNNAVLTIGREKFMKLLAAGGLFYHLYNQASYMVLDQGISPVTFSVGNTMKRVAVVVSSVMFFRNPVSALNWVGSLVAIGGTYLYTLATQKFSEEEKARKAASKAAPA